MPSSTPWPLVLRARRARLAVVEIYPDNPPPVLSPKDGNVQRIRFRTALLGTP